VNHAKWLENIKAGENARIIKDIPQLVTLLHSKFLEGNTLSLYSRT
jgi:hypothetical protein